MRPRATRSALAALLVAAAATSGALTAGCSLFETRTPEPPVGEGGTYVQPESPERVVENLGYAIQEMNAGNYRRAFAPDLTFRPSASAQAGASIWTGWSRAEEDGYFSTLAAAAQPGASHALQLADATLSVQSDERAQYDATYVLTVGHNRPGVPRTVQGRLSWTLAKADDGLWRIAAWTDQELPGTPSWSDLKAAFAT